MEDGIRRREHLACGRPRRWPLGVQEEIKPVRDEIESFKPHVVYTLLEEFHLRTRMTIISRAISN